MQYLALLYDTEGDASIPGSAEWDEDVADFDRFGEEAGDAIVGGEALAPSAEAVTIRPAAGQVTDGPFTELAEVLGGFFVLEADDLDQVLRMAAAIPTARTGAVEVRPIAGTWEQREDVPEGTTRYLATLHGVPDAADVPDSPEWDAAVADHVRFEEDHRDHVLGGAALHLAETATTVRVRDGATQLTDGPYAEIAEVLGGLYLLAAADRDTAVTVASRLPVGDGIVELRPIVEMDG